MGWGGEFRGWGFLGLQGGVGLPPGQEHGAVPKLPAAVRGRRWGFSPLISFRGGSDPTHPCPGTAASPAEGKTGGGDEL